MWCNDVNWEVAIILLNQGFFNTLIKQDNLFKNIKSFIIIIIISLLLLLLLLLLILLLLFYDKK